ncbi:ornithine cyclodeaminase family protein [Sphingopyxis sp.]|uniref:ornithine cyclodeaminase family protein n=1 Tax=Sphingopyxis sp. TaxID=1908224 RepID=UPI002D77B9A4|nr:ornithine cyclodeaminase family protein [Sphingopyxis sp.]HET6526809.1 ornithine cyclodeaminase family protein [Sphingopyxis sp.]
MTIKSIGTREVAAALPFWALINHLGAALTEVAAAPLRLRLSAPTGQELLVMPAMDDRFAGVKILTVTSGNGAKGLPVIGGHFMLIDTRTGSALALMEADELTARRTAAVSALASRALSREDASRLLIVGSGHLAPYMAEAHAAVRPISHIEIWGRTPEKVEATRKNISRRRPDLSVTIAGALASAVARADIVSVATRATEPLLKGAWVSPGTHVDLVGGYRPDMREIDDRGLTQSLVYVDTIEGVLAEAGDIRSPIERKVVGPDIIAGDIHDLLTGATSHSPDQRTLFKSVGTALADLAAATLVWQKLGE